MYDRSSEPFVAFYAARPILKEQQMVKTYWRPLLISVDPESGWTLFEMT